MNLTFAPQAWDDYTHWQAANPSIVTRINLLIRDALRTPYSGVGKPEPLRHALQGYWSRRIDSEHRMIYRVAQNTLWIAQLRFHY